jgi:hypothetical protein
MRERERENTGKRCKNTGNLTWPQRISLDVATDLEDERLEDGRRNAADVGVGVPVQVFLSLSLARSFSRCFYLSLLPLYYFMLGLG